MKALVLLSGGLDSAVCLATAVKLNGAENVIALNAYYGQKHSKEIECAKALADYYGVRYIQNNIEEVMRYSDCSLLNHSSQEIPVGEYAEQEREEGEPVTSYVPFRNGVLVSIATAMAISLGAEVVYLGIHHDDIAGNAYPDCSAEFYESMNKAVREGSGYKISLFAPFVGYNKAYIVKTGHELGVPFELTWSCYNGGEKPCGKCGTCIDRKKAFEINGLIDPIG